MNEVKSIYVYVFVLVDIHIYIYIHMYMVPPSYLPFGGLLGPTLSRAMPVDTLLRGHQECIQQKW